MLTQINLQQNICYETKNESRFQSNVLSEYFYLQDFVTILLPIILTELNILLYFYINYCVLQNDS